MFAVLLTTLMLPYAVTLIPTFLLWAELGLVNTYWPLVLPDWFGGSIFYIFLLRQFFLTLPRELDEAAVIDGANPVQVLRHVVVPLSRAALITVVIFSTLFEWNDFLGPLIYLNDSRRYTLGRTYHLLRWGQKYRYAACFGIPARRHRGGGRTVAEPAQLNDDFDLLRPIIGDGVHFPVRWRSEHARVQHRGPGHPGPPLLHPAAGAPESRRNP